MLLQQRQAIAVVFDICLAGPNILGHMLRYPSEPEGVNKLLHDLQGLNFDQQCLDFHRANREIRTTELLWIRKPLYGTSGKRWVGYCAEVAFTVELKSVAPTAVTAKKAVLAWSAIPIKAKVSKYFQKII